MQFEQIHPDFQLPVQSTAGAGGYDLFMPEAGKISARMNWASPPSVLVGLGFKAAVPVGYVALILPRSGAGAKHGLELRNTVGVIDSDYRGEWMVAVSQRESQDFSWAAGERLFQFVLVAVGSFKPELVKSLDETSRGIGGFGSTGTGQVET